MLPFTNFSDTISAHSCTPPKSEFLISFRPYKHTNPFDFCLCNANMDFFIARLLLAV